MLSPSKRADASHSLLVRSSTCKYSGQIRLDVVSDQAKRVVLFEVTLQPTSIGAVTIVVQNLEHGMSAAVGEISIHDFDVEDDDLPTEGSLLIPEVSDNPDALCTLNGQKRQVS